MIDFGVVLAQLLEGRRLTVEIGLADLRQRQIAVDILGGGLGRGVVGRMRTREADLQE